jgi:hypothetical protein
VLRGGNGGRIRGEMRDQLTLRERAAVYSSLSLSFILPPVGVGILVLGAGSIQPIGIGLLVVALVLLAIPVSPFLKAKVRRREERSRES